MNAVRQAWLYGHLLHYEGSMHAKCPRGFQLEHLVQKFENSSLVSGNPFFIAKSEAICQLIKHKNYVKGQTLTWEGWCSWRKLGQWSRRVQRWQTLGRGWRPRPQNLAFQAALRIWHPRYLLHPTREYHWPWSWCTQEHPCKQFPDHFNLELIENIAGGAWKDFQFSLGSW